MIWKRASYARLHQILTNPVYAGAYAYGRTTAEVVLREGTPRTVMRRRPRECWAVLLRDQHEAYITWERFERIQEMLSKNSQRRTATAPGAAKRGTALLAGLLRCRRCGQKLAVSYSGAKHDVRRYSCERQNSGWGEPRCLGFSAIDVDACLAHAVLEVVRPAAIEASLAAARDHMRACDEVIASLGLELEAARYAAERASRQYEAADPENRLVVDELERRWNAALGRVDELEKRIELERERLGSSAQPPSAEALRELGNDLPSVWNDPATDVRLKKRIVRTLVEEIIVDTIDTPPEILLIVHWHGGVHTELRVPRRQRGHRRNSPPPDVVEAVRALTLVCRDEEIARWLNHAGIITGGGNRWSRALVTSFRSARGIPVYTPERQDAEGWLTLEKAAALVGVASLTLKRAVERGVLPALRPLPHGPWLLRRDDLLHPETRVRLRKRHDELNRTPAAHDSRQLNLEVSST